MPLTATARSVDGGLRHEVLVDGRYSLFTDEPVAVGGTDTAPAPHELLPAALAACVSTTLLAYAAPRGIDLSGLRVDVVYDHKAEPRSFDVDISLPTAIDAKLRQRLERVAASCPVGRALATGATVHERISDSTAQLPTTA